MYLINIPPQVSPVYRGGQEQVQLTESRVPPLAHWTEHTARGDEERRDDNQGVTLELQ